MRKILVVDDSATMRQMTSMMLKSAGYEVVIATDGKDALAKMAADIDLLITDFNMPGMDGGEVVSAIRSGSVKKTVPILVLTTESADSQEVAQARAGATAWLRKPFQKEQLLAVVGRIAERVDF